MWFSLFFSVFSELDDQLIFIFALNHLIQNSSYVHLPKIKKVLHFWIWSHAVWRFRTWMQELRYNFEEQTIYFGWLESKAFNKGNRETSTWGNGTTAQRANER